MLPTLLVGFGFSAQTFHLPFIKHSDALTICGVVSSRPDDVHTILPGVKVFSSLSHALETLDPALCIITTPNHLHAEQAQQCLTAGCHVLVEKPFTLTLADAKSLVAQAKTSRGSLHVFHNRRFDGDFLTIKSLIGDNRFGNIRRMVTRFDRFRPVPRDRWRENAGAGAGIFWDLGPHLIDQCLQLFGLPDSVQASIRTLRKDGQSDDCFDVTLVYQDKQVLVGSSAFQAGKTLRFDVQGDKGSYRKFGLDPQELQLKEGINLGASEWGIEEDINNGIFHAETYDETITTCRGDYRAFYTQLITSLNSCSKSPCGADSVVPVIQVMELAWRSNVEKREIFVV